MNFLLKSLYGHSNTPPTMSVSGTENPFFVLGIGTSLYRALRDRPKVLWQLIRSSHKTLVCMLHPDRGGDPVAFRKVHEAYKELANAKAAAFQEMIDGHLNAHRYEFEIQHVREQTKRAIDSAQAISEKLVSELVSCALPGEEASERVSKALEKVLELKLTHAYAELESARKQSDPDWKSEVRRRIRSLQAQLFKLYEPGPRRTKK